MRTVKGEDFPANVAELVQNKFWMGKLKTAVGRFYPPYGAGLLDEPEDVLADVISRMCRRNAAGQDYIEQWNPAKAKFGTWVYTLTNRRCIHYYNSTKTAQGLGRRAAVPVLGGVELDMDETPGTFWVEPVAAGVDQEQEASVRELFEELADIHVVDRSNYAVEPTTFTFTLTGVLHEDGEAVALSVPQPLVGTSWRDDHASVLLLSTEYGLSSKELAVVLRVRPEDARHREKGALAEATRVWCGDERHMGTKAGRVAKPRARAGVRSDRPAEPEPSRTPDRDCGVAQYHPWVPVTHGTSPNG